MLLSLGKRVDGEIQALMPLQTAVIKNDEGAVLAGAFPVENRYIHVIDEHSAFVARHGTQRDLVPPEMVGDDDVIGKRAGQ